MNFRAYARQAATDNQGEPFIEHGPTNEGTPGTGGNVPPACAYCGGTYFEPPQDNGRIIRVECEECGGTMVSHGGAWMPDLIGQPDNHPSDLADPASGGVGGIGNINPKVPQPRREEDLSSRTAMPSRKHTPPSDLYFDTHDAQPGSEHHDEAEESHPGWTHHLLRAHRSELEGDRGKPAGMVGMIYYSRSPEGAEHPGVGIHDMRTNTAHRGQGIASAMQDELRRQHPQHMIDHGSRTPSGAGWHSQYQDPGDPKLDLDHPDNVHDWKRYRPTRLADDLAQKDLTHLGATDWCRHRHAGHCWLPRHEPQQGVALYVPQDRGVCPWTTASMQQINCPVSEPGPMAGMTRAGSTTSSFGHATHLNWDDIGERHPHIYGDPEEHGKAAEYGDGPGIGQAANELAHGRESDPHGENHSAWDLHFHEDHVHPRHVDYARHGGLSDPRVRHAYEGFKNGADVPPAVLVHRHGVYQVADGHHRAEGAELAGVHLPAYVAHSPYPDEPHHDYEDGATKAPYHGAEPTEAVDPHRRTASTSTTWAEPEWRFHVLATWADVRAKAKGIRSENGVSIVSALADGITGHVNGDTGVYETQINYVPGTFKIGYWQCGCAWASYAWGRSAPYRRFEGRMCSHALALTYEAQAQGMFGREVREDTQRPGWMRDKVRVRHDRDTRDHDVRAASLVPSEGRSAWDLGVGAQAALDPDGVYPTDHGLDLERSPIHAFAVEAYAVQGDPADVMRVYLAAGIEHAAARDLLREGYEAHADIRAIMAKTEQKPDEPTHAGMVLKAQDTGRILMIQRSHHDESDPAAGTWEFPGGGREDHDHTSLHSGIREFEEEVGHEFPTGGHVSHVWQSGNGVYQGHVVVVPHEKVIDLSGGRRTVNPDDPDGDDHEQSAWWDPDHARKNPALRPECKDSPWDKIKTASLPARTADYTSDGSLNELQPDYRPKAPPRAPDAGQAENPGSTGFATSQDPPEWENASQRAETMSLSPAFADLHQPEPALPHTTGEDEVEEPGERFRSQMASEIDSTESLQPNDGRTASTGGVSDIVARFQATAAAQALQTNGGPGAMDIAEAARQHLAGSGGIQRTAMAEFSATERHELITEGTGARARNFGDLKISGTHYEAIEAALHTEQSLDPTDLFD